MGNNVGKFTSDVTDRIDKFKANKGIAVQCLVDGAATGLPAGTLMGGVTFYANKMQMSSMQSNPSLSPDQKRHMENMAKFQPKTLPAAMLAFATLLGVQKGLTTAFKHYRKDKHDVWNSVGPAFGAGAAYAAVQGNFSQVPTIAIGFAAFSAILFPIARHFGWDEESRQAAASSPQFDANAQYVQSQAMLSHLGLTKYHKNVKNGLLTDSTIMLWTDSALAECRIPPGPRLLILYHIDQVSKHKRNPLVPSTPIQIPEDYQPPGKGRK